MGLELGLITEEGLYQDSQGEKWSYRKSPVRSTAPYILIRISDKQVRLFWENGLALDHVHADITKSFPKDDYPEMYL